VNLERILEFIGNHPLLILAFAATLGALLASEISRRLSGMKTVDAVGATQLSNRESAVFLDIRDDGEYRGGHIPDAIHIPLKQLSERISELSKHKNYPVIAYCRSGSRSNGAGRILKKNGFENVYNLTGGIIAWQKANLPLSKK
jgi:rhodanese-related sulfurtransferase